MGIFRRYVLAGAAAGVLLPKTSAMAQSASAAMPPGNSLDELIKRSHESNAALMRGDVDGYRDFTKFSDDFSFMSPFGGEPTHAAAFTEERIQAMGAFFEGGSLDTHVVASYVSGDMVVLATVEHSYVAVGGLPKQDWWLRVTLVYRREGGRWLLAHRHADPLRQGISLDAAAALARRAVA